MKKRVLRMRAQRKNAGEVDGGEEGRAEVGAFEGRKEYLYVGNQCGDWQTRSASLLCFSQEPIAPMKTLAPSVALARTKCGSPSIDTARSRTGRSSRRGTRRPVALASKSRFELVLLPVLPIGVIETRETSCVVGTGPTSEKDDRKMEVRNMSGASHRTRKLAVPEIMVDGSRGGGE